MLSGWAVSHPGLAESPKRPLLESKLFLKKVFDSTWSTGVSCETWTAWGTLISQGSPCPSQLEGPASVSSAKLEDTKLSQRVCLRSEANTHNSIIETTTQFSTYGAVCLLREANTLAPHRGFSFAKPLKRAPPAGRGRGNPG